MNYHSNKIHNINGQKLTAEIRDKGSIHKIYAHKTYTILNDNSRRLMQLPRVYSGYEVIPSDRYSEGYFISHHHCCSFRSILSINGRWVLDLPYYCYAYEHTYRKLPLGLSLKLDCIALCGEIQHAYRKLKEKTRFNYYRVKWNFSLMRRYHEYKEQKKWEKFWSSLGGE